MITAIILIVLLGAAVGGVLVYRNNAKKVEDAVKRSEAAYKAFKK